MPGACACIQEGDCVSMLPIHKTIVSAGILLCAGTVGLPRAAYALSGCSNAHLTGTYTVQLANTNTLAVVNALNADPNTPAPPPPSGGFGNNPNSLGSVLPGIGRFYFNGSGAIIGQAMNSSGFTSNVTV